MHIYLKWNMYSILFDIVKLPYPIKALFYKAVFSKNM